VNLLRFQCPRRFGRIFADSIGGKNSSYKCWLSVNSALVETRELSCLCVRGGVADGVCD
jgi:hypothetical protein